MEQSELDAAREYARDKVSYSADTHFLAGVRWARSQRPDDERIKAYILKLWNSIGKTKDEGINNAIRMNLEWCVFHTLRVLDGRVFHVEQFKSDK